ncbi:MAG: hypothetical protein ACM359_12430 [Bacillota bacterium]
MIGLLLAPLSWAADPQSANVQITRRLAKLQQQYRAVSSIQFKTSSNLSATDQGGPQLSPIMRGSCAYWASGENYRIDTKLEPLQAPPDESITAYDGVRWQFFEEKTSRLIYKKANENRQPICLPNPLLAPLAFFRPPAGENGVKLLWAEAQSPAFWDALGRDVQWVQATDDGQGFTAECRGRLSDGTPFVSHIRFGTQPDYLPTEIDWIPEGKAAIRYRLEQYEQQVVDGQTFYWPKQVRFSLSDPKQPIKGELITSIEELKLNAKIPADLFTLDFTKPAIIYDDDARAFVKTKGGYRVSPSILATEGSVAVDGPKAVAIGEAPAATQASKQASPSAPKPHPSALPPATLADTRYLGLRWAGLVFTAIGVALLVTYLRSYLANRRGRGMEC